MFSIEAIPCLTALPLQARLGLLFPFLPFFFPPVLSSAGMGLVFSHPGSPVHRIRPQLAHTPPTGLVWGFAGVVSLSCPQTCQKSPHRSKFGFSPQNELTPPPKGGGACIAFLGFVEFALLVYNRPTRLKRGGFGASLVSFPYPVPKNCTQGHTGPSLVLTVFSWNALALAGMTSPSPACNSPPLG